jgi:hypothetical protein
MLNLVDIYDVNRTYMQSLEVTSELTALRREDQRVPRRHGMFGIPRCVGRVERTDSAVALS